MPCYDLGRSSFSVLQRQPLAVTTVQQLPADLIPRKGKLRVSQHSIDGGRLSPQVQGCLWVGKLA